MEIATAGATQSSGAVHMAIASSAHAGATAVAPDDTVDTYVWAEEYAFLRALYDSADNTSPKFRFPDLISACVTLAFRGENAPERIFRYLRSELVLRPRAATRRREAMWRTQYDLIRGLQRSRANRHPYPQFQLDQFTTACVALVRRAGSAHQCVYDQARQNTAERAGSSDSARAVT